MSNKYQNVGFIGAGNMAYGLIKGIINSQNGIDIFIYDPNIERQNFIKSTLNAEVLNSVGEIIKNCDVVFIAVKAIVMRDVLEVAAEAVNNMKEEKKDLIFISIAGGIKIKFMEEVFMQIVEDKSNIKIVRVMPNINSIVGKGMSAVCYNSNVNEDELKKVVAILEMSSRVLTIEEKYFDAVTALSGSGPAYIFLIAEGLIEAGVKLGLPKNVATILTVQTLVGSGELLNFWDPNGCFTKELKDMVTSPGGTTAYGLAKLEEGRIKYVIDCAVNAAYLRSKEFGK